MTTATEKTKTRTGWAIPSGRDAEGIVVRIWDENTAPYGDYGVVTSVAWVENNNRPSQCFTGYQYTICKSTEEGTINGGLVQMCGEGFLSWEGKRFYDNAIPFDDDIPF